MTRDQAESEIMTKRGANRKKTAKNSANASVITSKVLNIG